MTFGKFYWLYLFFILGNISYAQSLHLMTYNIRLDVASDGLNAWPYRKDFLSSQIQFYEPDILGIQEAMPHQVVDLQQLLSQYSQVGIGREGLGKGESSNIFYKKEKLRVIETNTFWLSDTPNEISIGWDAACNRVCTFALFEEISSNKKWFVFNTHLDHMGEQARTNGITLIMDKIGQYNIHNYPVVLMGDFNLEPQDKRILDIKKKMNDASEITTIKPFGPIGTFNNFDFNTTVTKRIDYIFISKNNQLKVKKYAVLSDSKDLRYPSDHLPVFVEISFEE